MKKLNYFFMFVALVMSTFFLQSLTSCSNSEEEIVTPPLDIQKTLHNYTWMKKIFSFDGVETEFDGFEFEMLSVINESNGIVSEAEMELKLPTSIRTEVNTITYNPFSFKVKVLSTENQITFSGEYPNVIGDVKLSVDGIYKENTLRVNLNREFPQASFADKTYELTLNEETFDLNEMGDNENVLEWNEPLTLIQYAKDGMGKYMSYLQDKTQRAVYQFTFQADGNLVIKKRNSEMQDFETLSGKFSYYMADGEIGFIEMERKFAAEFIKLVTANEFAIEDGFFSTTYLFDDILTIPFCYRNEGTTLWLAIGDRTGFKNLKDILLSWRYDAGDYYDLEGADPLGFVYMGWNKRENYSDQIWWRLIEK